MAKLTKIRWNRNFKNPNQYFCEATKKRIDEKFEKIQKWFEGGVAFEIFTPIGPHVNEKEKYL